MIWDVNKLVRSYTNLTFSRKQKRRKTKGLVGGGGGNTTSCGGTSRVMVRRSTFVYVSMQGNTKKRPTRGIFPTLNIYILKVVAN